MDKQQTAGGLLRKARTAAGLTQRQLAERAHVAQSVISAYESGRRQPSLPVLARLVRATGHRLDLDVVPTGPSAPLGGPLGRRVRQRRDSIKDVVNAHRASNPRVFGSVARGDEHEGSDIDVLVDLAPGSGLFTLLRLQEALSQLLDARVEVVPADSLRSSVRMSIGQDMVAI